MRIVKLSQESRQNLLENLLKRSPGNYGQYQDTVQEIVDRVKTEGDKALFELTAKFDWDGISKENVKVTEEEVREAYDTIDPALTETIRKSLKNIRDYHEKQKQYSWFDTTPEGTMLGQKVTPLASAGVYVPGGKAVYPSSVLMKYCSGENCRRGSCGHVYTLQQRRKSKSGRPGGSQRGRR